jgi:hypothetical protein
MVICFPVTGVSVEKAAGIDPKQPRSCFHANVLGIKAKTNSSQGASWMPNLQVKVLRLCEGLGGELAC